MYVIAPYVCLDRPNLYSVNMPAKPDKDSVLQLHNIDLRIPEQHLNVTFNSSPDGRRVLRSPSVNQLWSHVVGEL